MGNRAVICFDDYRNEHAIGIYLHWNGGRDSVEAMLQATREIMGGRLGDKTYARARLMQVISTVLPGNMSFGMGLCSELDCDNYDNGTYVIDSATMQIKERLFFTGEEQNEHDLAEFVISIMKCVRAAANADSDPSNKADYIKEVSVTDPDTNASVEVAIYKERESGGMFGVDSSYILSLSEDDPVNSPFSGKEVFLIGD